MLEILKNRIKLVTVNQQSTIGSKALSQKVELNWLRRSSSCIFCLPQVYKDIDHCDNSLLFNFNTIL